MGDPTNFWLIRHAVVAENARAMLYGCMDVELCPDSLISQVLHYQALADRLPRPAQWLVTPLSRTQRTARAIFAAGYPPAEPRVVAELQEQNLGDWQGLPHAALPSQLTLPVHPFWPLDGEEQPPGGESMADVIVRVGRCLEQLAEEYSTQDIIVVSHGGAIRAAVAHALRIAANNALHLAIQNLSLTRLERHADGWRVVCVNEMGAV